RFGEDALTDRHVLGADDADDLVATPRERDPGQDDVADVLERNAVELRAALSVFELRAVHQLASATNPQLLEDHLRGILYGDLVAGDGHAPDVRVVGIDDIGAIESELSATRTVDDETPVQRDRFARQTV